MKKLLSIILVICCIAALCGCETVEKISEVDLPPVPTADAVEEAAPSAEVPNAVTETEHQHIIINVETTEHEAYDPQQGTELILDFSYETPYVHIPANVAAEDSINEFIAMLNESYYTGDTYGIVYDSGCAPGYNNMLTMAEDNYNYIVNSAVNFESELATLGCHRSVNVQRLDEGVLSLCYYDYINMGNGQESIAYKAYNFDTRSGELLTLDALSSDTDAMKAFVVSYIQEEQGAELDIIFSEGNWYFSHRGLHIVTDTYDAEGAEAGTWEYVVPYSALAEYLKPEYIPDEIDQTASFTVVPAEALSESSKEIIDILKFQDDGEALYLVAEGMAHNVRISRVDYIDGFFETERLWYCSTMEDCALQLLTNVPEGMPELKLSYTDADGEHELYLSQSGEDGSFLLVDGSIEAVG